MVPWSFFLCYDLVMTTTPTAGASSPKPCKRGRGPSPAKTAATRQVLVEAALGAFLENGFEATRMGDVAVRAGVAKGTAYLHFASKEALFADVLREVILDAQAGRPRGRPHLDEPTRDFLMRTMPPALHELQRTGRFRILYVVMTEGPRFPDLVRAYREIVIAPVLRLVRLLAARAERRGELRTDALTRLPMLLVAPAVVTALWNFVFAGDEPLDMATVAAAYLDLVFERPVRGSTPLPPRARAVRSNAKPARRVAAKPPAP